MTKPEKTPTADVGLLLEFMYRFGQAMLACGEQTAKVELVLRRIASAYGMRRSRVVVFPTALFISVHVGEDERVTLAEGPTQGLRLDQIADVYELGDLAQRGEIQPRDGIDRLAGILKKPTRFGAVGIIVGHIILTVGLAFVLDSSTVNVIATAILGAVIGVVKALNRDRTILAVPVPVLSALLVSSLVFLGIKYGLPMDPRCSLIPPLVSFLPGALLTLGMVELAYGDMVSGSSRLMTGFIQLVLLAFGFGGRGSVGGIQSGKFGGYLAIRECDGLGVVSALGRCDCFWSRRLPAFFCAPRFLAMDVVCAAGRICHPAALLSVDGKRCRQWLFCDAGCNPSRLFDPIKVQRAAGHGYVSPQFLVARTRCDGTDERDTVAKRSRGRHRRIDQLGFLIGFDCARYVGGRVALQVAHRKIRLVATTDRSRGDVLPTQSRTLVPRLRRS